jgi:hypothetical protein
MSRRSSKKNQDWKGGLAAMSTEKNKDENIPPFADAYYEERACQEEVYLEETEEELRVILGEESPSIENKNIYEERKYAVEELITGDSDDPPLCEDAVEEMLRGVLRDLDG